MEQRYEQTSTQDIVNKQWYLLPLQKKILKKNNVALFDGKLRLDPQKKFLIDLKEDTTLSFKKWYSIPFQQEGIFRDELNKLVEDNILEIHKGSAWVSSIFIVSKKDGCIQLVSGFSELKKAIKQKAFLIPKIQDIMNQCGCYWCFTKIDLLMFVYYSELNNKSKGLCTVNIPYALHGYKRLGMGVKVSPDFV